MQKNMFKNLRWIIVAIVIVILTAACAARTKSTAPVALKVMSYNTHHCNPPGKANVIDLNAIAAVIKNEQPDVVALQEIDVNAARSGKINQASEIASKAGDPYYYFADAIPFDGGQYGVAILSKYPLSETQTHRLRTDEKLGGERRVFATAVVQLPNGKKFQFGCTHLDAQSDDINRRLQIREILDVTASMTLPIIIAGDFNAREGSEVMKMLDSKFTRTCKQCLPTIQEDGEPMAIDFIAFRPSGTFNIKSHKVLNHTSASDHYPVVAVLTFE